AGAAGNGSAGKRHIYLHATWRTGSSFLGELFNQHPDVFYLYEPMWHLWQALYPGDALSLQGALRDMLRALFRCDFSVLRLYTAPSGHRDRLEIGLIDGATCEETCPPRALRELEAECRKYPVVVIKDVRLLELSALLPLLREPGLNLRVVQLFRDPRAVICQSWLRDLLLARRAPDWLRRRYTQLRYEDLVREPRAELRRLLRFAGLTVPPALEDFVLNMTRGAAYSSDRPFLISARDAREAVHAWRGRLSRQQVRQVEAACGEAMSILAYPLS
ncbi:CHST7 sulfotransferase, partial [Hylia prasina]|nr:CHST7 sulfotransferase [Hylia prasina]